ncbi:MAG TPA: hypothetical protein VFH88_03025 [Candidatus Krumholzibacteria bacterium]|nr:hypothetical protein [Candidatus Krumholzibacteria bacterium]
MDIKLQIVREGSHWKIRQLGSGKPEPGDTITWEFADKSGPARAILQFPSGVFDVSEAEDPTGDERGPARTLSRHNTAQLDGSEGGGRLTLQVSRHAKASSTHQYAVFVMSGGQPSYAIGHNPPPEINLGP